MLTPLLPCACVPRALRLLHPLVMDTVALYPHAKGYPWKRSLKELAKTLLGRSDMIFACRVY